MNVVQLDPEELIHWALETGVWDGRPTQSPQLINNLAHRITTLLFEKEGFEFYELATQLALLGMNQPEEREVIRQDLLEEGIMPNGILIQAGFMKSAKKFWKKHKVEIIVGVAALSLSVGAAIVILSKLSEDTSEPPKPPSSPPPPTKSSAKAATKIPSQKEPAVQSEPPFLHSTTPVQPQNTTQIPTLEALKLKEFSSESHSTDPFHCFLQKAPLQSAQAPYLSPKTGLDAPKQWQESSMCPKAPFSNSVVPQWSQQEPTLNLPTLPQQEEIKSSYSFLGYLARFIGYDVCQHTGMEDLPLPNYSDIQTSQRVLSVPDPSIPYRIGSNNGIWNSPKSAQENWNYLKNLMPSSTPTEVVYNNTHALLDILEACFLNLSGCSPNTAKLHQEAWTEFHEKNREHPNLKFLQFCHSQGVIHVKNALSTLPPEIRNRVIAVALGPATIIPEELCFKAHHYASKRDIVYRLESLREKYFGWLPALLNKLFGKYVSKDQEDGELVLLDPHPDAPLFDHDFQSPTFKEVIKDHIDNYLEKGGEYVSEGQ